MELLAYIAVAGACWFLFKPSNKNQQAAILPMDQSVDTFIKRAEDTFTRPTPQGDIDYDLDTIAGRVAQVESGNRQFDANGNVIVSKAGARGIMQLMPGTAAQLGVNPDDAAQNLQGGKNYLAQLFAKFGNWVDALAAYNWGMGNVMKAKAENRPYPSSVNDYVNKVLGS
ncbi:MAG: lytic transglycosylase domain-containing protein [Terracidiphilus sp.]